MKRLIQKYSPFALALTLLIGLHFSIQINPNQGHITFKTSSSIKNKKLPRTARVKERAQYNLELMRDPKTGIIPRDARQSELAYKKESQLFKTGNDVFEWTQAGPNNVGGRTRGFAIDQTDNTVLIAAGVSGGIWKSTNKGLNWQLKTPDFQNKNVTWLTQDPRTGHTQKWYAVTGEFDGNSAGSPSSGFRGFGVFKSIDNGETWTLLPNATNPNITSWNSPFDYMSKVVVNPTNGDVYIAANGGVILKSTDEGVNFTSVLGEFGSFNYSDVEITTSGKIIAVLSDDGNDSNPAFPNAGIWTSDDNGTNWTDITPATFPSSYNRTVLALAPSNQNTLYTFTVNGGSHYFFKINLSDNSSIDRSEFLPNFNDDTDKPGAFSTQGGYDMHITVKPDDEDFIVLGAVNLYRTVNGFTTKPYPGASPTQTDRRKMWIGGYANTDANYGLYTNHHPDQHGFAFDPTNSNIAYSAHDGGISYTSNITSSTVSWSKRNNGYFVTQFYHGSITHFDNDQQLVGGAQDNGSPFFTSESGSSSDASSGDGAYSFIGTTKMYVSSQLGTLQRYDLIENTITYINQINPNTNDARFIHPFEADRNDDNIIYYPSGTGIYRTNDAGENGASSWTNLKSVVKTKIGLSITAIKSSISPAHILYFAGSDVQNPQNLSPVLYRFVNSDTSKSAPVEIPITGAPEGGYVNDIGINPEDANELLIAISNYNVDGIFYSNDGTNFTSVEGNLTGNDTNRGPSIRTAAITHVNDKKVFLVGTTTGVYSTTLMDGSNTIWVSEGNSTIGNSIVNWLAYRANDSNIAAFTHGRGAFYGVPSTGVANEKESLGLVNSFELNQNYPNPFNPSTTINYSLKQSGHVELIVFDITGRKISTLVNETQSNGSQTVSFDASSLASGTYIYQLKYTNSIGSSFIQTKKMTLIK